MAIQVQLRRGTATQNNAFTGAIGELVFDTTNKQLRIHDGSQAGGFKIGTGDFPTGTANVALGNTALDSLDGSSPGGNNVAVGHNALTANTTASNNVAVGSGALATSTTATDNTAVGFQALAANDSGADNVAVGDEAGHDITSGSRNTILGSKAGDAATTTDDTTLVGYGAGGGAIMTGHDNTGVGANALAAVTSGASNVAIGKDAGTSINTGNHNTIVGFEAGDALTDADYNVAIGHGALGADTKGDRSVAIGLNALRAQNFTSVTTTNNTAVGDNAGYSITTGANNTFIGALAGDGTDDGAANTAVGKSALTSNCGNKNTAVGALAGQGVTGSNNTIIGEECGILCTGDGNTFVGAYNSSTGGCGEAMTTGDKNTILGAFNGNQDGHDMRTDNNTIVISDGDGTVRVMINNEGYQRIKSVNASLVSGATHTHTHDNNDTEGFLFEQQHGSFVSSAVKINAHRVANSGYEMLLTRSGNNADVEHYLRGDGNAYADGSWNGGGADYAEYFEWSDGNSDNQDRTGYTVVLDGNKIKLSTSDDAAANVIGAVSVNPSVVGDSDIQRWKGKYLLDDFGAYQTEEYTETWWIDENNVKQSYNTDKIPDDVTVPDDATVDTKDEKDNTLVRRKLNPDYDADQAYVSREDRKEWATIGMMGKLRIRKGQKTGDRWIKMRDISDTVEEWLVR